MALVAGACDAGEDEMALRALEEVEDAQQGLMVFHEGARECFDGFETCVLGSGTGEDVDGCLGTLRECLPERPEICHRPEFGPGGDRPGRPEFERPDFEDEDLERPMLEACHDALRTCVDEGEDPQACLDAGRECVREVVEARFERICERRLARCDHHFGTRHPEACEHISARCEEGLPFGQRPSRPDEGERPEGE